MATHPLFPHRSVRNNSIEDDGKSALLAAQPGLDLQLEASLVDMESSRNSPSAEAAWEPFRKLLEGEAATREPEAGALGTSCRLPLLI